MSGRSSTDRLRQVQLERESKLGGTTFEIYWIDEECAKVGKRVRDDDGYVWIVREVYGTKTRGELDIDYGTWRDFEAVLGD